jgi:hypothetical protein
MCYSQQNKQGLPEGLVCCVGQHGGLAHTHVTNRQVTQRTVHMQLPAPCWKCLRMFAAHPSQSITTTQCLSGRIGAYSQLPRMLHGPGPSALPGRKMPMLTAASARSKGAAPASSPSPARGEHRKQSSNKEINHSAHKAGHSIPQG